jgi:hypothetical protein
MDPPGLPHPDRQRNIRTQHAAIDPGQPRQSLNSAALGRAAAPQASLRRGGPGRKLQAAALTPAALPGRAAWKSRFSWSAGQAAAAAAVVVFFRLHADHGRTGQVRAAAAAHLRAADHRLAGVSGLLQCRGLSAGLRRRPGTGRTLSPSCRLLPQISSSASNTASLSRPARPPGPAPAIAAWPALQCPAGRPAVLRVQPRQGHIYVDL